MIFPNKNSLISIGKIVKSFGINGHLLVNSEFLDDYNFNKRIAIFVIGNIASYHSS